MNYELPSQKQECPLCGRYISEWQRAFGKTVKIKGREVHSSCVTTVNAAEVQIEGLRT